MSLLRDLIDTYLNCSQATDLAEPLPYLYHGSFGAHLDVVLDAQGRLQAIQVLPRAESTEIPMTEGSAGRSGTNPLPHPLCDCLQYLAPDLERYGLKALEHDKYLAQLRDWHDFDPDDPKLRAVLAYVSRGTLAHDLVSRGIVELSGEGSIRQAGSYPDKRQRPALLQLTQRLEKAVVRWVVEVPGDPEPQAWRDGKLKASWVRFVRSRQDKPGLCLVTGETVGALATQHPKGLFGAAYNAKLISSNDTRGFTWRGRMRSDLEVFAMGAEASQMAHVALRWLLRTQGHVDAKAKTAHVAWTPRGAALPALEAGTADLFGEDAGLDALMAATEAAGAQALAADPGQRFGLALDRLMSGYGARLEDSDAAVVLSLAAPSTGTLAVTSYRRMPASQLLARVRRWHERHAWPLNGTRGEPKRFVGAPSPKAMLDAAYGEKAQATRLRAARARILAHLVEGRCAPAEIVKAAVRRAVNRHAFGGDPIERSRYEELLSVACALVNGQSPQEHTPVTIDLANTDRNYLFGRLLAIASRIERDAVESGGEHLKRLTHAERLQSRFFQRPMSTLASITAKLVPYRARLRTRRGWRLDLLEREFDAVMAGFSPGAFSDQALNGEALLGLSLENARLWALVSAPRAQRDQPEAGPGGTTDQTPATEPATPAATG